MLAYAPTDQSGKNANARSSANAAYAQAVGRGAGTVVTFEVLSEEEKKQRSNRCDVRVKVEGGGRARLNSLPLMERNIR